MFVLARRASEEIVIDGHIRIRVTRIQGHRVWLGITAPEKVRVDWADVHECRGLHPTATPPHEQSTAAGLPGVQE